MSREIKFRAWNKHFKGMEYPNENGHNFPHKYSVENNGVMLNVGFFWMQYTGLKDKNGKEIWESDILECTFSHKPLRAVMEWDSDKYGWKTIAPIDKWEVIGNIHENPELL